MRCFSRLVGTSYEVCLKRILQPITVTSIDRLQIRTSTANFLSGGLGSFAFWGMAIPVDNIKK